MKWLHLGDPHKGYAVHGHHPRGTTLFHGIISISEIRQLRLNTIGLSMGLSIYMFAGPTDNRALSEYILSLGLRMYPILMQQPEIALDDDPAAYPYCFLSAIQREDLHPYGSPARIGAATDPLLQMMRPYFREPNLLVVGDIFCSDDVRELFGVTKPIFTKLSKWIRKHWERLQTGQYIGPQAQMLHAQRATLAYFPPGVPIEQRID
jgi:hypothetical protein